LVEKLSVPNPPYYLVERGTKEIFDLVEKLSVPNPPYYLVERGTNEIFDLTAKLSVSSKISNQPKVDEMSRARVTLL
jgi:hypothetical protein